MTLPHETRERPPPNERDEEFTGITRSPIHLLHRAGQCATDIFTAEMQGLDVTPRQFAVLLAVSEKEGLSQTDLVTLTGIDRSTLADIVRRMLKKGLVQRRRTREDARAYAVKLTEQGMQLLAAARPRVESVDVRILRTLSGDQRTALIHDLKSIVRTLQPSGSATVQRDDPA